MRKKIVIGIIGEQAGGKGAGANIIKEQYGGLRFTVSNVLKKILDTLHIENSRENFTKLALNLKKTFGDQIIIKALLEEIKRAEDELIIIDGLRMPGDPEVFHNEFKDNFYLIYITADQKIRYERSIKRGEKEGESRASFEDFQENEKKGTESLIPQVAQSADFKIINNNSLENLKKDILEIMKKIY